MTRADGRSDNVSSTNLTEKNEHVEKISATSDEVIITNEDGTPSGKYIRSDPEVLGQEQKYSNLSLTTQPSEDGRSRNRSSASSSVDTTPDKDAVNELEKKEDDRHFFLKSSLNICFPIEFKRKGAVEKKKTFEWSLFRHVPFMVHCCGNFLFLLAFRTAFMFLPAIAQSKGLTRQESALLLTISGAFDTFGRIATGFIMDLKPMRPLRPYFFTMLLFIIAGASLIIPSLTTFASFGIVCAVYGFMTGSFIAQKMVVLVDILGREKMPSSLGIQRLFQGFGTLIGPPLAG